MPPKNMDNLFINYPGRNDIQGESADTLLPSTSRPQRSATATAPRALQPLGALQRNDRGTPESSQSGNIARNISTRRSVQPQTPSEIATPATDFANDAHFMLLDCAAATSTLRSFGSSESRQRQSRVILENLASRADALAKQTEIKNGISKEQAIIKFEDVCQLLRPDQLETIADFLNDPSIEKLGTGASAAAFGSPLARDIVDTLRKVSDNQETHRLKSQLVSHAPVNASAHAYRNADEFQQPSPQFMADLDALLQHLEKPRSPVRADAVRQDMKGILAPDLDTADGVDQHRAIGYALYIATNDQLARIAKTVKIAKEPLPTLVLDELTERRNRCLGPATPTPFRLRTDNVSNDAVDPGLENTGQLDGHASPTAALLGSRRQQTNEARNSQFDKGLEKLLGGWLSGIEKSPGATPSSEKSDKKLLGWVMVEIDKHWKNTMQGKNRPVATVEQTNDMLERCCASLKPDELQKIAGWLDKDTVSRMAMHADRNSANRDNPQQVLLISLLLNAVHRVSAANTVLSSPRIFAENGRRDASQSITSLHLANAMEDRSKKIVEAFVENTVAVASHLQDSIGTPLARQAVTSTFIPEGRTDGQERQAVNALTGALTRDQRDRISEAVKTLTSMEKMSSRYLSDYKKVFEKRQHLRRNLDKSNTHTVGKDPAHEHIVQDNLARERGFLRMAIREGVSPEHDILDRLADNLLESEERRLAAGGYARPTELMAHYAAQNAHGKATTLIRLAEQISFLRTAIDLTKPPAPSAPKQLMASVVRALRTGTVEAPTSERVGSQAHDEKLIESIADFIRRNIAPLTPNAKEFDQDTTHALDAAGELVGIKLEPSFSHRKRVDHFAKKLEVIGHQIVKIDNADNVREKMKAARQAGGHGNPEHPPSGEAQIVHQAFDDYRGPINLAGFEALRELIEVSSETDISVLDDALNNLTDKGRKLIAKGVRTGAITGMWYSAAPTAENDNVASELDNKFSELLGNLKRATKSWSQQGV